MGAEAWHVRWLNLVDQSLQLDLVTIDLFQVFCVAECNVLETVDLTEQPENVTFILALTLDCKDFAEVGLLRNALHHVIDELGL